MPFEIIRNDITKVSADAIVNAANSGLQQGGGVCGAIFDAAGAEELQKECNRIGHCEVGNVVITSGYKLPARYIIHTVGPVWQGGSNNEEQQLMNCYINSLNLAKEYELESIAFPLISSGIYGYPKDKALKSAISAIGDFLLENDMMVYIVVYDKAAFVISEKLFSSVSEFIDENYVNEHISGRDISRNLNEFNLRSYNLEEAIKETLEFPLKPKGKVQPQDFLNPYVDPKLTNIISQLDESFSETLLRIIDEKGKTDAEVYKKANVDRRLFSKIRSDADYRPSKITVLAFAIALELSLDGTRSLLEKAGFALTRSSKFDIIVEYFILQGNYNIFEINEVLFKFDQSLIRA